MLYRESVCDRHNLRIYSMRLAEITLFPPSCKQNDRTALQLALDKGHVEVASLLIEKGANFDTLDGVSDWSGREFHTFRNRIHIDGSFRCALIGSTNA